MAMTRAVDPCTEYIREHGELTEKVMDEHNIFKIASDVGLTSKDARVLNRQRAVVLNKAATLRRFREVKEKKEREGLEREEKKKVRAEAALEREKKKDEKRLLAEQKKIGALEALKVVKGGKGSGEKKSGPKRKAETTPSPSRLPKKVCIKPPLPSEARVSSKGRAIKSKVLE